MCQPPPVFSVPWIKKKCCLHFSLCLLHNIFKWQKVHCSLCKMHAANLDNLNKYACCTSNAWQILDVFLYETKELSNIICNNCQTTQNPCMVNCEIPCTIKKKSIWQMKSTLQDSLYNKEATKIVHQKKGNRKNMVKKKHLKVLREGNCTYLLI